MFTPHDAATDDATWPPHLPHRQIDALIDRLETGLSLDPADAHRLLGQVAREAQRLRALVTRLSASKLAEADREAQQVVADALGHADALRSAGLRALESRLDEADEVLATMRQAFRTELRAAELADLSAHRSRSRASDRPAPDGDRG